MSKVAKFFWFLFVVTVVVVTFIQFNYDPVTERLDAEAYDFEKFIQNSVKDPQSFDRVELRRTGTGSICLTFRATNGFGAMVQSHAVKTRNGEIQIDGVNDTSQNLWYAYCGLGSGGRILYF